MKNFLIKFTEREGLNYQIFQASKYTFGKILNTHNFILRKQKIKKFFKKNKIVKVQFGAGSGKLGEAKKSAFATPESKNLVVLASNKPEAESNNSLELSISASSDIETFVLVPANVGCSFTVVMLLKLSTLTTFDITDVALELKLPNLSTALIR